MPVYYDQYGHTYQTADVPFDYNQMSQIPGVEDLTVGELASQANPSIQQTVYGTWADVSLPNTPVNTIGTGNTAAVIPGDPVGTVLAAVIGFAQAIYGDTEPGIVRHSQGYLDADPTGGVRPGLIELPKIVLPPWANVINRR